jgi:hypothetical protein
MTVVEGPRTAGLVGRVQNILLKPAAEWDVIAAESATTQGLFMGYAAPLALLPVIGSVLGAILGALIFHTVFGGLGVGLIIALVGAVLGYVISLASTFVFGLIINALASSFDGTSDSTQAMKVAVYGMTAAWVAGILSFIPLLGALLGLVGFGYSCYLIYLGVAKLMKPPADKAVIYAVVAILIYIVLFAVVFWIISIITGIIIAMTVGTAALTGAAMLAH